jgi:exonuclease III
VDRGKRTDFLSGLQRVGYGHVHQTERAKGQNQVLVASNIEQADGTLSAPDVDEAAATNFVHRFLPSERLHVVGFRVPHYQSEKPKQPEKLERYWRQFVRMAIGFAEQRVVFIGDFNIGHAKADAPGQAAIRKLVKTGYRMCAEEGGLDRALVSSSLAVRSFAVVYEAAGFRLAGKSGLSDHGMLRVDVE